MGKNKKEKSGGNIGYKILHFLFFISSLLLFAVVLYINILPVKYLAILAGILVLLNLIFRFFLCKKKLKSKIKKFFSFLAFILSMLFIGSSFFIFKTFDVLDEMTENFKIYTYYVLVNDKSDYKELKDIENKSLGFYDNNSAIVSIALSDLKEKISYKEDSYDNLYGLGAGLLDGDVDSILIEKSDKIKLENAASSGEDKTLNGFDKKIKTLYTFKVKLKNDASVVKVTSNAFNIYISGMDEYGKVANSSRSDVNIVVTVNPKTKQILLTNIPRDYYVKLHDTNGYKDKLTHAGIYGIDTSVATIEDLLDIKIDYYVKVNFSSLVNVVDALGGVEVYSEYNFQSWNGYNFSKGYNKVNGDQALAFVRERKSFNDGDNQRGKNQQAMIDAMFRKATKPSVITKYNSLLNSLNNSMITDMPMKAITKLAKMQLRENSKWSITSNTLTGTGSSAYTYSMPSQLLYVTLPDDNSVSNAKELIKKVLDNQVLESSYDSDSTDVHAVTKSYVTQSVKKSSVKSETVEKEKEVANSESDQIIKDNNLLEEKDDEKKDQTDLDDNQSVDNDNNNDGNDNDNDNSGNTSGDDGSSSDDQPEPPGDESIVND